MMRREFEEFLAVERAKNRARRRLRRYETVCLVGAGLAAMLYVYAFTMVQP